MDSVETFFYLVPTIVLLGLAILIIDLYRNVRKYVVLKTKLTQAQLDAMTSSKGSKE